MVLGGILMRKNVEDMTILKVNSRADELVNRRFTEKELRDALVDFGAIGDFHNVDESGLVADYAFIAPIFKERGYIDIYYLKIPYGDKQIYVTEVSVSDE
jgi:hypothetical protein